MKRKLRDRDIIDFSVKKNWEQSTEWYSMIIKKAENYNSFPRTCINSGASKIASTSTLSICDSDCSVNISLSFFLRKWHISEHFFSPEASWWWWWSSSSSLQRLREKNLKDSPKHNIENTLHFTQTIQYTKK